MNKYQYQCIEATGALTIGCNYAPRYQAKIKQSPK